MIKHLLLGIRFTRNVVHPQTDPAHVCLHGGRVVLHAGASGLSQEHPAEVLLERPLVEQLMPWVAHRPAFGQRLDAPRDRVDDRGEAWLPACRGLGAPPHRTVLCPQTRDAHRSTTSDRKVW